MHNPVKITTVVTPASTYDLIDVATLRTYLDIGDFDEDPYLTLIIAQVSQACSNYCNRVFPVEAVLDRFWPARDGYPIAMRGAAPPVQLSRWPVQSVVSVVETINNVATTLVADTDYLLDATRGQLTRLDAMGYPKKWQANALAVTYAAGYAPIPADLTIAVVSWIKGLRAARTRDPMLRSENAAGVYEASYWFGTGPGNSGGVPPDVCAILDNYSEPQIG